MGKNLLEKAGRIQVPAAREKGGLSHPSVATTPSDASPRNAAPASPKTAPGALMGFMASQSVAMKENEELRNQVLQFEGASPVRKLDPKKVRGSEWANRHESSFISAEFKDFKAEIESAGGNVQPIKVRPIFSGKERGVGRSNPPSDETAFEFEIVYGHRRHRACLELGLPVLALIEATSEQTLFVEMERENRQRADLSAWEQGVMYARALDKGLYPSNKQMASAIGRNLGDVGKALSLARLPRVVVDAFASPLDLQFRWAKLLNDAQQADPEGLLTRAQELKKRAGAMVPKAILNALLDVSTTPAISLMHEETVLRRRGTTYGTIASNVDGHVIIKLTRGLTELQKKAVAEAILSVIQT